MYQNHAPNSGHGNGGKSFSENAAAQRFNLRQGNGWRMNLEKVKNAYAVSSQSRYLARTVFVHSSDMERKRAPKGPVSWPWCSRWNHVGTLAAIILHILAAQLSRSIDHRISPSGRVRDRWPTDEITMMELCSGNASIDQFLTRSSRVVEAH